MKEITRIHLAKKPFEIEIDAKKDLQKYLEDIEAAVQSSDVMYEIEARVIEILLENGVEIGGVISSSEVVKIKNQMGKVGDFIDDSESSAEQKSTVEEKPKKRLMRDTENNLAAGVAAGMATYFNIDVSIVRLIWVLMIIFTSGAGLIFYIIAALILPAAKTSSEKLQMQGLSPTIENITTEVETPKKINNLNKFLKNSTRVALGILFGLAIVGILISTVVGVYVLIDAISVMNGMESQGWIIAIFISCLIGVVGVMMALCSLMIASITWKIKKILVWILAVGLTISMISLAFMTATGIRFGDVFRAERDRSYSTLDIELPEDLEGIKYVRSGDNLAPYVIVTSPNSHISSAENKDKIVAKLKYLNIQKQTETPEVKVARDGESLVVYVDKIKSCSSHSLFDVNCLVRDYIVEFYGPVTYYSGNESLVEDN